LLGAPTSKMVPIASTPDTKCSHALIEASS
jgi:hypothetical protein